MSQRLPFPLHHPQTGTRLFAHGNATQGHRNGGVARFLLARLHQAISAAENVAGVPQADAVREKLNDRLARMITVILMNQQVDRCLAENPETGRGIAAFQCDRVNVLERPGHEEKIFGEQLLPALEDVAFADQTVNPARLRHFILAAVAQESYIENRARQQIAHRP